MKNLSSLIWGWLVAGALLLAGPDARAQAPAWQTAVAISSTGATVTATTTDASGNVYLAGNFSGAVSVGSTTLSSVGAQDMFVAKWSSATSSIVWAQRAGSPNVDYAIVLAVSGTGVYVAGYFSGTATFGSTQVVSRGSEDGFVAKLTDGAAAATWGWVVPLGGTASDYALTLVANGPNVYVGGCSIAPRLFLALLQSPTGPSMNLRPMAL